MQMSAVASVVTETAPQLELKGELEGILMLTLIALHRCHFGAGDWTAETPQILLFRLRRETER